VRSEIEKNKDALGSLVNNRDFLLSLCPKEFLEKRKQDHLQKREAIKKKWIADHIANPKLDYNIIFKTDDEIHEGAKMQFSFHGKDHLGTSNGQNQDPRAKKTVKDFSDHQKMKPQDW